jgi:putative nucleotidyltransferase with HDIG domain
MKLKWIQRIDNYRLSSESSGSGPKGEKSSKNLIIFFCCALLVSIILSFLLSGYSRIRIPNYSEGDIARADVSVPSELFLLDEQATKARRAAARDAMPPVYRYDEASQPNLASHISQAFSACRQALGSGMGSGSSYSFRALPSELQAAIQEQVRLISPEIDTTLLNFFVRERFSKDIEDQLLSALAKTQAPYVVANNRNLITNTGSIEAVSYPGKERQTIQIQEIRDLDHARQRLREEVDQSLKASLQIRRIASEWLSGLLRANLEFDLEGTEARKKAAADSVDPVVRQLKRGKIIVRQGDEISADQLRQINAVREQAPNLRSMPQFVATNLLLLVLLVVMGLLLRTSPIRQWNLAKLIALSFGTLVGSMAILKIFWFVSESLSRNFVASPFNDSRLFFPVLPFALGTMLVTLLAGERIAQIFLIFYCPLAVQIAGGGFQDFLFVIAISLMGILSVHNARHRMAIVGAGFKISAAAAVLFVAAQLARRAPLDFSTGSFGIAMAVLSGPITASLLSFTLPLCERLFLVTTEIRLSELGNLNLPLLRELMVRAPGTYNHSIAVGTLAQGAAHAIGLNALFLRVACLYHDVGKLRHPQYFIENKGEDENPHDSMDPLDSVKFIREHISEGIRLSRKAKLPPAIIDIIPQHHGTKVMSYFYDKAKEQAGGDTSAICADDFRHLGPKPQTKEAAIIMLADGVEAAARTLQDHTPERLLVMIQKITTATIEDGQLAECDLTLSEIERVTFSFLETLGSFYHSRIDYPSFDFSLKTGSQEEA